MGIWRYDGQLPPGARNATWRASGGSDMGELRGTHVPVLLERCLELLAPALDRPGRPRVHVDATLGLGGHAEAVLTAHPAAVLVGLDRDTEALAHARERLAPYAGRTHLVHAVYDELPDVLDRLGIEAVDGVLFDLGVSSLQLDEPDRGFAYAQRRAAGHADGPDARDDGGGGRQHVRRGAARPGPAGVRRGEVRHADRVGDRAGTGSGTGSPPPPGWPSWCGTRSRRRRGAPAAHPAKRTFQALRIEVNGELTALEAALPAALDALAPGGRIVVLSYHSLEDRIAKRALAERARATGPVDLPVELPGTGPTLRLLTRGRGARRGGGGGEPARRVGAAAGRGTDRARQATAREQRRRRVKALHQPVRANDRAGIVTNRGRGHDRQQARTTVGGPDRGAAFGTTGSPDGRRTAALRRALRSRRRTGGQAAAPRLRVAPPPPVSGPRAPFVALVLALVVGGVLGILVVNTKINENAFRLDRLTKQQAALDLQQQQLEREIAEAEAPGNLRRGRAQARPGRRPARRRSSGCRTAR